MAQYSFEHLDIQDVKAFKDVKRNETQTLNSWLHQGPD